MIYRSINKQHKYSAGQIIDHTSALSLFFMQCFIHRNFIIDNVRVMLFYWIGF